MVEVERVSIPQAVSTVATENDFKTSDSNSLLVSIPQAVSTVATPVEKMEYNGTEFQYRKR